MKGVKIFQNIRYSAEIKETQDTFIMSKRAKKKEKKTMFEQYKAAKLKPANGNILKKKYTIYYRIQLSQTFIKYHSYMFQL